MENLKLVSSLASDKKKKTMIKVGELTIGMDFLVIAGPCSIESEEQIINAAHLVKKAGANMLRGGAYKSRTSPYSFQGLGHEGLLYLQKAGKVVQLPIITEITDTRDVQLIAGITDIFQVGARNMQNFPLLVELGRQKKPVLLKRGMHATIEEWLYSAEYILNAGNSNVILCERGIRTIETYTRNTLDLSSVSAVSGLSHLPVIVDPSHATGRTALIAPMSLAAIMAGCDGLEIEVHPSPQTALSDANQQLTPKEFELLMHDVKDTLELRKKLKFRYPM